MGNSPKELRGAIDAVAKQFRSLENLVQRHASDLHKLLRDAPWKQNKTSIAPQNTSEGKSDGAIREDIFIPPPNVPPSPCNPPQPEYPWYKTFQGWKPKLDAAKIILEVVAIPFAIAYAVVTALQWRDLRHNFATDERAWVKVGEIKFPIVNREVLAYTTISSIGKSPAFDAIVTSVLEILPSKQSPTFSLSGSNRTYFGGVMFPGEKAENIPIAKESITQPQVDSFAAGDSYYVAFGKITYRDQFGKHWTRFCEWAYNGTAPHPESKYFYAKPCTEYNAVGDGDPPK
jgi:hypothetical protein